MSEKSTLTDKELLAASRPVNTLWNRLFLDPAAAKTGLWIANNTSLRPLTITLISFLLSLVSAGLFLTGHWFLLVIGAIVFQVSSLADSIDGLIARAKPGSGSVLALLADNVLDPWRVILNVMALAYGQYYISRDVSIFFWSTLFLCMHFMDWTLPKSIAKVRGAYKGLYTPVINRGDRFLLRLKDIFGKYRMKVVFVGSHERELIVLFIAPIIGHLETMLIIGTAVTVLFFFFRLWFDTALVKNELVKGTQEYLGDSENPWEANKKV